MAATLVEMAKLIALFTIVPLVDLFLLLQLSDVMGAVPTFALVLTTGVVGAWLAKQQGLSVIRAWRQSIKKGALPQEGLVGSLLVLVGGVLLVTPGVLTDLVGFTLLIPPSRRLVARQVDTYARRKLGMPPRVDEADQPGKPGKQGKPDANGVVEAEVVERPQG